MTSYDLEGRALAPLTELFSADEFPLADFLPTDAHAGVFAGLYYTEASASVYGGAVRFDLWLVWEGELALKPPGTDGLALVVGSTGGGWTAAEVEAVIGPEPSLRLVDVPVTVRVSRDVLRDTDTDGPAQLTVTATLEVSADGLDIETRDPLSLPECEIAGSGVTVSALGVAWNFTRGRTLPEAEAAGIEGEFLGVAFQEATLTLPPDLADAPKLTFEYCCLGTGGFTGGVVATRPVAGAWTIDLGGFDVELERIGVRFQRSALVLGEIQAVLRRLDLFDTDVAVDLHLAAGGLRIALSAAADRQARHAGADVASDGLLTLTKPDVVAMSLTSATLAISAGGGVLTLSGTVTPLIRLPGGGALPAFAVEALTITSDGAVSVDGGWIDLPAATRIDLGGFALELTRAGLGSEPDGQRWVGFSGTLYLVSGVPITAAVDGLKLRWDDAGVKGVELSGVRLAFAVDKVMALDAEIRHIPEQGRFEGAGSLQLVALNLTVSARVVIGKRADYTYLYIYLLVQPPVGVPIFNTGLALYSVEALYARHMKPGKSSAERWFQDWYRRPDLGVVDQKKWINERDSQAFGAGVTVGTLADKGYSVAVKGLLVVLVPGPVLLLDARANLLRDPASLAAPAAQAMFNALVVYDAVNGTLEAAVEPHYLYPDNGELVDVTGIAEAFYSFNDPRAWHLYLGRSEPEQRIRARLLSLFDANAYLMLEPDTLELGGFIGYRVVYDVSPATLTFEAFIEGAAFVSLHPKQFRGELHLQAAVRVAVAGVGVGATASAVMTAQAPQPFEVHGTVQVRADLPWPLPDVEASAELHWSQPGPPQLTLPLQIAGIMHRQTTASWPLSQTPVVPLDGVVSLVFERAVQDTAGIGPNAEPAPTRRVGELELAARLTALSIEVEDGGSWKPYATVNGQPRPLYGMWQTQPGNRTEGNRRLLLWVRSPYEWLRPLDETSIGQLELADGFDPCMPTPPAQTVNFDDASSQRLPAGVAYPHRGIAWTPGDYGGAIIDVPTATRDATVAVAPPRAYSRCLLLPDQLGLVPRSAPVDPAAGAALAVSAPPLRIQFTGDLAGVAVLALASGPWSIEAFDAAGNSLGRTEATGPLIIGQPFRTSQLVLRTDGIRRVDVHCVTKTALLALGVQHAPTATESAARKGALELSLERFKGAEPVFEPNRRYRMMVTTQVEDVGHRTLEDAQIIEAPAGATTTVSGPTCTVVQAFEFCTEGPPGAATLSPIGPSPDADAGLDTLEQYVREFVPPRGASAFYRNYDLGVAFTADYVDQMYRSDNRTLGIRLSSDRGEEVAVANTMGKGNEVVLRREERTWLSTLERASCKLTVTESDLVRESAVRCQTQGAPLAARRRYDAVLVAEPAGPREATRPLYAWSFVTSAFLNFADHLRPGPMRTAALEADPARWFAVADAAAGDAAELVAFTAMFGDVALERSLPGGVELHAVTSSASTEALLLSSPEPFDWQRIKLSLSRVEIDSEKIGSLPVSMPVAIRVLRDGDGTRALLLRRDRGGALPLDDGDYTLRATFRRNRGAGHPVYSERGNTADENATIKFPIPAL